jgi:hypothetical protein
MTLKSSYSKFIPFALHLLLIIFISTVSSADQVEFKSGRVIEGTVIELNSIYIRINSEDEHSSVFNRNEILSITISGIKIVEEPEAPPEVSSVTPPAAQSASPISASTQAQMEKVNSLASTLGAPEEAHLMARMVQQELNAAVESFDTSSADFLRVQFKKEMSRQWRGMMYSLDVLEYFTPGISSALRVMMTSCKDFVLAEKNQNMVRAVSIFFYVLFCFPLMLIAQRLYLPSWMAWVPIIQLTLIVKMAERPMWWFFLLFFPIINLFIWLMLWIDITEMFQKPVLLAVLMLIPGFQLVIPWYLVLTTQFR